MTAKTYTQLIAEATEIKNETRLRANTATRVGTAITDIIDSVQVATGVTGLTVDATDTATMQANSAAIQAALASGADVVLPAGTYYLAEGAALATVCIQIGSLSNLTLRGAGEGITILKLGASQNSHVINIDGATNIKIRGLTVDGNRDNNTGTSWHGIRTGTSGCSGLVIEDVTAQNTRGYGYGLQGGDKKRVRMTRCTAADTGLDGCDMKNTADNSEDIVIEAYSARRWGLDLSQTEQAGIDCRGPCQLIGIWCSEGPADGHYIRFREGETVDPSLGAHYSHLRGFVCEGNSGATSIGVYIPAHDVQVSGGYVKDCFLGVNPVGERVSVSDVTCESCDDESFQVSVGAENCRIRDCHSLTATGSGFRIRAPRCKMESCSSGGDITSGIVTESTATGFNSYGFDCEGTAGTMVGVDIASADAAIFGGEISGCFRGLSTVGARTRFMGVVSYSNTDDGCIIGDAADDSVVTGCTLRNNTDDGITVRADRCRIFGNTIASNGGTGLDIVSTADSTRVDNNQFTSNGTAYGDAGTNTRLGLLNDGLLSPLAMSSVQVFVGTGSPNFAAQIGSTFLRTDGSTTGVASGTFVSYVKEFGSGVATGWVGK